MYSNYWCCGGPTTLISGVAMVVISTHLVGRVTSCGSLSQAGIWCQRHWCPASGPMAPWHCWFQSDHCSFDMGMFGGMLDFSDVEIPSPKDFLIWHHTNLNHLQNLWCFHSGPLGILNLEISYWKWTTVVLCLHAFTHHKSLLWARHNLF